MSGEKKTEFELVRTPDGFFHDLIVEAVGSHRVEIRPETELYVVHLLKSFLSTENLFVQDGNGNYSEKPLIFLYHEASAEKTDEARKAMFQKVGDVSLYLSGFFQERLTKKKVDVDYYASLGGNAYLQAAQYYPTGSHQIVFHELSTKFLALVSVLSWISEKTTPRTEKNLLWFYEHWRETGSKKAEKLLREEGILTDEDSTCRKKN